MEKISKPKLKFIAVFVIIIFALLGNKALAAGLFLSPSSGEYPNGQGFKVTVYVSSSDQAINAVSGTVRFPSNILNVVSVSKAGSIISNWVSEPSFSNSSGTVNFEGIVLNPGYTGSSGSILTINFRGAAAGAAALSVTGGSVLANDGRGTEVFSGASGANFNIVQPPTPDPNTPTDTPAPTPVAGGIAVASSTHPASDKWYSNKDIKFTWNRPANIFGYSFSLDQNPNTVPDNVLDTTVTTNKSYTGVEDGVWYFHIRGRAQSASSAFGPTTHYKVQIDSVAPASFKLDVKESTVTFETTDALSGIDRFQAVVDGQVVSENANSPYTFTDLAIGSRSLQIIAFDKAGNKTEASATAQITPADVTPATTTPFWMEAVAIPWYLLILLNLVILILLGVIIKLLLGRNKNQFGSEANTIDELQTDIDQTLEKLRNEFDHRLLEINAKSLDKLVQRESKIAKAISSDIKKTKALFDKKTTRTPKKK